MCAPERRTVKSRCFASSCEEVPTENSICGSSLGTFSFAQSPISADKKSRGRSAEFRRSSAHFGKGQWSMRLGWSPSTRAGLLGTGAMLPSSHAPLTCPPRRRRPRTRRGRGLGGTPSLGRPRERRPLFGGVYVLVPIWLGAPRPAWRAILGLPWDVSDFLGRYLVTVFFI
jgi:hypothetical protein